MEAFGKVNQYVTRGPDGPTHLFFTINLATGVTPFCCHFNTNEDKWVEATSCFYQLTVKRVEVSHGFYRPKREEFDAAGPETKKHVLMGGLLMAPLYEALQKNDPSPVPSVTVGWSAWAAYVKLLYGVELAGSPEEEQARA